MPFKPQVTEESNIIKIEEIIPETGRLNLSVLGSFP
jgi:hypothetical protein